jgi:hypothetical protein
MASHDDFKVVSSNASRGSRVCVFVGGDREFLKEDVKAYLTAPMLPLNAPTFHLSSHL